ncbi:MAG: ABC transporter ATP-binding protein [Ruminococcus sp.]|nr:ABC transporter ATP-binding protein [Ruminococcus sp.]
MKKKQNSVLKPLLGYAKPYKGLWCLSLIFSVITVAATLYAPILIGNAVDEIVGKGDVDLRALGFILVKLGITALVTGASQWLMSLCTNRLTYKVVARLREELYQKLHRLPLSYIDSHPHGDIISRIITDTEQISDGLLMGFAQLFTGICTIFGTLIFMMTISVKIALAVVLITPLSLFVARFISRNTFRLFAEQSKVRGELTSLVEEMTGNSKTVVAFGYEQRAEERFEQLNQQLNTIGVKATFFSSLTNPSTRFVNGLVYTTVGIIGAFAVIGGGFSVGRLTSFLTYANQYTKPFNEISGVITELQSALASAARVFGLLALKEEEPDSKGAIVLESADGTVDIDSVYFSYDSKVRLIEGFDLHVKSGSRIAIVGPTGCGKTTVINLLMRFYDPDSGEIRISGVPVRDCTRESMRRQWGMVLQETWLKTGTVRENIAYGKPDATDGEIIAAAKAAHCHSFIKRLPKGYDTVISDGFASVSQGQKQLLCIARVMLSLPPMLILDEATSSIDTMTEIRIQRAFEKMMKGRTSFIIAHRLSTIRNADVIIVMRDGHIVEQGSHEQLLAKKGFYSQLYNSQFDQDNA